VEVRAASPILSRVERFGRIGSTNDIVRSWLADGTPEVAIAIADEQSAGRGRAGRTWTAPAGTSLLVSAGFRPTWLRPEHTWRLAAIVALAMAEAAEKVASLQPGSLGLKWPNDLVIERDGAIGKLGGVLGESEGIGTAEVRAVVGIGVNVDWSGHDVPAEIASSMTTLRAVADAPVPIDDLASAYLDRLADAIAMLRHGEFAADAWADRQVTTGRSIVVELPAGGRRGGRANGVDPETGALLVDPEGPGREARPIHAADVVHVRLAGPRV
jgi:BirA family biotin operon repressor/biotin-[acetyl-CoA-carboxylase] ligase